MEKVKQALTDFTSRSGHHDTTVHEAVAPAVTQETVKPHQHEEINTAVDKEIHQDHYHRTVQPVQDREVLPETHTTKLGSVQHLEFDHRDHESVKRNLIQDQAQYKNERVVEGTTQSRSVAPAIGGEHVHHHIHETIQPVVQKETVQPNVVHTTVPIHEVHHNKATHHDTTALPAITMDEFKQKGGSLAGREERYDEFEGVPKNIGGGTTGGFGHHRDHHGVGAATGTGAGLTGSAHHSDPTGPHDSRLGNKADPRVDSDRVGTAGNTLGASGSGHHHDHHGTGAGLTSSTQRSDPTGPHDSRLGNKADPRVDSDRLGTTGNTAGAGGHGAGQYSSDTGAELSSGSRHVGTDGPIGNSHTKANTSEHLRDSDLPKALTEDKSRFNPSTGHHHDSTASTGQKHSVADKFNPRKDADGDGKAGIMD